MTETKIHPTALVSPSAVVGKGTKVGAYSLIGPNVKLGKDCDIRSHVVIDGKTTLGNQVRVLPFSAIGLEPQHLKYRGEETEVLIGDRVTFHESVTVHRATEFGGGITSIGDDCYIMAYAHVAHDCRVGHHVILANSVQLGGHVEVGDHVTIGGVSAVAQFCRVGSYCYVGGGSTLRKDLPPFLLGKGHEFEVQGINSIGLERNGFSELAVKRLKKLYRIFYLQKLTVSRAIESIVTEMGDVDELKVFLDFVKSSKSGVLRP